ncbi:hypothetical protein C8R43DRAFT_1051639 [Mycena crocata]|nr:hypothetical protein C8R43DRAFT_1051639 [Mycena crocata]
MSGKEDSVQRLPPELILLIIEQLRYDLETLKHASLVSRLWLHTSRSYLFEHIRLSAPPTDNPRTTCSVLYEVLRASPHIVPYIRHLTILPGSGGAWTNPHPTTLRWISSDETLPPLLDILATANPARIQSLQIRLSSEHWRELPVSLRTAIRTLINCPSMHDVDFTGFNLLEAAVFGTCPNLKRLKLSELSNEIVLDKNAAAKRPVARCESLTVLDTVHVTNILSWAISTPTFGALTELRLGFHPLDDMELVGLMVSHVSETLESLHLQPVYAPWPTPSNAIDLSPLHALTSLRLSLGLSVQSNPFPWVIFLLSALGPNLIAHLTIDLRVGENHANTRANVLALPWAELDGALSQPHLARLSRLTVTYFAYEPPYPSTGQVSQGIVEWLEDELPRILPRSRTREVFEAYELKFPPSRFFYWPGPLSWSETVGVED